MKNSGIICINTKKVVSLQIKLENRTIMVPTFEKFLYPFLLLLKNGEKTTSQMVDEVAEYLGLTEKQANPSTQILATRYSLLKI